MPIDEALTGDCWAPGLISSRSSRGSLTVPGWCASPGVLCREGKTGNDGSDGISHLARSTGSLSRGADAVLVRRQCDLCRSESQPRACASHEPGTWDGERP